MAWVRTLRSYDVGQREVLALEEQRFPAHLRQRVREAVAEVQRRRVVAPSKATPGPARCARLLAGHRNQFDCRLLDVGVEIMPGPDAFPTLENKGRLEEVRDGQADVDSQWDEYIADLKKAGLDEYQQLKMDNLVEGVPHLQPLSQFLN